MATKNATFRNGQADYFGAQFDGGKIELLDSTDNTLATINLQDPAWGSASGGVINAAGLPLPFTGTAAAGSGTNITSARLLSSDSSSQITGLSVGNSNAHITLDNTNIAENQNGEVSSISVTIPADIADA